MRAYVRRACVPAVLMSALLLTGCSGGGSDDASPKQTPASEVPIDEPTEEPSESASSSAPGPELTVGETGSYDVGETDDTGENYKVTSKMQVTVVSAKYVTPAEIDTTNKPEHGQFVELTLTLKNVGKAPAKFSAYGLMTWEDDKTAAQDATTLEGVGEGPELDTTYKPGQSVTGKLILDVARKGGTVSYVGSDDLDAEGPVFTIKLPK
ncbi:DUF4352 domain-containing protein [Streptomyces scabiei]|uniref:DUF4352 domain-containing protein n=2 Tax=Streptomyces scabiei TaxID=1930 RepID=UPI0029A18A71|nr:DUF4352 domain-containing protein [Streptomyces scabiei]MDX2575881.1 DUF4352 domain-containing protein [Streptomyces scabiei]MDX3145499.1 DUF4352 domain-containing protein [Streptomyces scabiei]